MVSLTLFYYPKVTFVTKPNKLKPLFLTLLVISSSQALYFLFNSRNLRPIADDYCHAAYAGLGFWSSFQAWYTTWASDVFAVIVNYLLMGFPIIYFPYSIASAVTIFSATVMITFLLYYLLFKNLKIFSIIIFYPIVLMSFLSFWVTNTIFFKETIFKNLSSMILHWQNINSQYTFLAALLVLIIFFLLKTVSSQKYHWLLIFLLGFLSGTFGIVLVLTVFSVLVLYLIKPYLLRDKNLFLRIILFSTGLALGLLFSYFSPGSQARAKILENNPNRIGLDFVALVNWTFPTAVIEWLQGILHFGSLVVVLFGLLAGFLSSHIALRRSFKELAESALTLFILSLFAAVLSQLSEAFTYVAFWHLVIPYLFIYFSLFLFSFLAGMQLDSKFSMNKYLFVSVLTGLALGVSGLGVHKAVTEINERKERWQVGPAPVSGISDIENKEDWIFSCWIEMKKYKGYPDRENF